MTSKTSFFNSGIYKSTVKRYLWGSILYFIILFMSTGLSIFLNVDIYRPIEDASYWIDNPLILNSSYIGVPMLLAIIVPTVTAVLVFRFMHSKNQAVHIHSLPVSRRANFISQISASFTLMLIPVILNGIILLFISLGRYGNYYTPYSCLQWVMYNVYALFLMFSCATLAAFLTGNSFGMVAVNILIHSFLLLMASSLSIMAEMFLFGYSTNNTIINILSENNFFTVCFDIMNSYFSEGLKLFNIIKYVLCAAAFYVLSYVLYKKRRLENVGDISGFKCLNHIFKYIVCFFAAMFAFATFGQYIDRSPAVFAFIVIIVSIAAYTAAEMVLKKTLKIWYSWKGYAVFAVCLGLMFGLFYGTTFFGYETRVPQKADIDGVTITRIYGQRDNVYTKNKDIINITLDAHKSITKKDSIQKLSAYNVYNEEYTTIYITYKLKDGSTLSRDYLVTVDKCHEIMSKCYLVDEYKILAEDAFIDDEKIKRVYLTNHEMVDVDKNEIMPLIREDIKNLSYDELYPRYDADRLPTKYYIQMEYVRQNNPDINNGGVYLHGAGIEITTKYVKTFEYLWEKGYRPVDY